MAVPKNRHTKSRRDTKRSHLKLSRAQFSACPKCSKPVLAHRMCENCGTYRGREIVNVLAKLDKRERKAKQKELKEQEEVQSASPQGELNMEEMSK